jgi:hypothetical protein
MVGGSVCGFRGLGFRGFLESRRFRRRRLPGGLQEEATRSAVAKKNPDPMADAAATVPKENTDLPGPHPKSLSDPSSWKTAEGFAARTAPTMAQ